MEDLEASQSNVLGVPKKTLSASMKVFEADYKCDREMCILLHTLCPCVIESIILNTIGHDLETHPDFERCVYRPMGYFSGIYTNTITIEDHQHSSKAGLCANEWRDVTAKMRR
jgi:hypothetical protein